MLVFGAALVGGLVAFACFNGYPARVFMGDTGSLALGGALAALAAFSRLSVFVPIIGVMYAMTSLSVIMQVGYYKMTKKRIFRMAPLHHHFELKGAHENTIVVWYTVVTALAGLASVLMILMLN
jgi:phospho-N-acetylmuramoyl-pentapeptide-transferase